MLIADTFGLLFNPNHFTMRKSLSLLILLAGIAIGAGASGFVSDKELPALPAAQCSVTAMDVDDFNDIVLVYVAPDMEIPQCATVPEVSFDVPQICAGFIADLEKPPGLICLPWQANPKSKISQGWEYQNISPPCTQSKETTMDPSGKYTYRNPRDAI